MNSQKTFNKAQNPTLRKGVVSGSGFSAFRSSKLKQYKNEKI